MMIMLIIISIFVVFNRFGLAFAKLGGSETSGSNYYIYTAYPVLYRPVLKLSYTWFGGSCTWFLKGRAIPSRHFRVRNITHPIDKRNLNRSELTLDETDAFATSQSRGTIRIFVMNCTFDYWRDMQLSTGKYLVQYPVISAPTLRGANALLASSRWLGRFRPLKMSCMTGEVSFTEKVLDGYQEGRQDEPSSCLPRKAHDLEWNEVLILASPKNGTVQCDFAGKPAPVVEFHRNGVVLNASSPLLRSDSQSAWWQCVARNRHGSREMYQLRLVHTNMTSVSVRNASEVSVSFPARLHCAMSPRGRRVVVWLQKDGHGRLKLRHIGASVQLETTRYLLARDLVAAPNRKHQFWCIACALRAPAGSCVIQPFGVRFDRSYEGEDDARFPQAQSTGRQRLTTSQSVIPFMYGEVEAVPYNPARYYWVFFAIFPVIIVFFYSTFTCIYRYRWCLQCNRGQVLLFTRNNTSNSNNSAFNPPTPRRFRILPIRNVTNHVPVRSVADHVPIRNITNHVPVRSVTNHVPIRNVTDHMPIRSITRRMPSRSGPLPLTPPLPWPVVRQPGRQTDHPSPQPSRSSQPIQRLTYVAIAPQDQEDPYEEENWEISFTRMSFLRVLGAGNFGRVYLAKLDPGSSFERRVAVKTSKDCCDIAGEISSCSDEEISSRSVDSSVSQIVEEVELMKSLGHHENVIDFIGYSISPSGQPYLLMEFCSRGNLGDYLRGRAKHYDNVTMDKMRSETLVLQNFACQVARGMKFLSDKKFIHRDLATRNVLVNERFVCKVSDFGLSRKLHGNESYYIQKPGKFPWKWMAPEILLRSRPLYSTKSDV